MQPSMPNLTSTKGEPRSHIKTIANDLKQNFSVPNKINIPYIPTVSKEYYSLQYKATQGLKN